MSQAAVQEGEDISERMQVKGFSLLDNLDNINAETCKFTIATETWSMTSCLLREDRYGLCAPCGVQLSENVMVSFQVLSLDWDADGEKLAVLQHGNSALIMWDSLTRYAHRYLYGTWIF